MTVQALRKVDDRMMTVMLNDCCYVAGLVVLGTANHVVSLTSGGGSVETK